MTAQAYTPPVDIRHVDVDRSGQWLAAGWQDFLRTPLVSLTYGGCLTVISLLLTFGLFRADLGSLLLPAAGGFILLAPILVVGLYDVSSRLERGQPVSLKHVFGAFRDNMGQLSAMGVVLLIVWLAWVEIAIFLFAIFFSDTPPPLDRFIEDVALSLSGVPLLLIGTAIGAAFATVIFAMTAVSVPMLYDRPVDVVTAIGASILAVRANWQVMCGWAAMIALISICAVVTFFIGLAVALPVLAYATWHAYRDLIGGTAVDVPPSPGSAEMATGKR